MPSGSFRENNCRTKLADNMQFLEFATEAECTDALCELIAKTAEASIASAGRFSLVLTGGKTPTHLYMKLAKLRTDWTKWIIFLSDERCVANSSTELNANLVRDLFTNQVSIPVNQLHFIPTEADGHKQIEKSLRRYPEFDFVLLGIGEDGHTAALFPGRPSDNESDVITVSDAPKPPAQRITLTSKRLSQAKYVAYLSGGYDKQKAISAIRAGANLPPNEISGKISTTLYSWR